MKHEAYRSSYLEHSDNKVAINLDMLRAHIETLITSEKLVASLSQYIRMGRGGGKPSSMSREQSQSISQAVSAMAQYSDSATMDVASTFCF